MQTFLCLPKNYRNKRELRGAKFGAGGKMHNKQKASVWTLHARIWGVIIINLGELETYPKQKSENANNNVTAFGGGMLSP